MRPPYSQRASNIKTLRAHACTLFSLAWLRDWASDGTRIIGQNAIDSAVNRLQRQSGASRADFLRRGTKLDEAVKAYRADDFAGRTPPRIRTMNGGSVRGDLFPAIDAGNAALLFVDYGVIQDAGKGIGSFRLGHAVVGLKGTSTDTVTIIDPLRYQPVQWPHGLVVDAMERFGARPWMNGRGAFAIVYPSPTFLQVARAQRDRARAQVAQTEALLAVSRRSLAECRAGTPPTDPAALAEARASGIRDAAAAAMLVV